MSSLALRVRIGARAWHPRCMAPENASGLITWVYGETIAKVRVRRGDVGAFGGLGFGGGGFRGFWRVRRGLWLKAVGHLRIGKNGRFGSGLLQKWVRPNQGFLVKSFESTVYGLLAAAVRY